MTARTVASALAVSLSLLACGSSPPDAPGGDDAPDAGVPATDFDVVVSTTKLPILSGATASLEITLTRRGSFTSAVTIAADGLPAGVSAAPVTLAPGATTGSLVLTADAGAPHSLPTGVTIVASADAARATTTATVTVYGSPGSLDQSFGNLMLPMGAGDDYAYATAVQPDGKILLAGRAAEHGGDFAVMRLTRDGALDTTFGDAGKVLTDFGGADTAYAIAVQPDGKIVVAGNATVSGWGLDFAAARYNADGTLDTTFSGDGKLTTTFGVDSDTAYAIAIEPDGKIVLGGDTTRSSSATGIDFALARYLPDGSLDASFNFTGWVTAAIGANNSRDTIYALGLQQIDGETRIVAAGGEGDFKLTRYHANGALDTTFGIQGIVANVYQTLGGAARAVAVAPSGAVFVAGFVANQAGNDFALIELTPSGQIDPTFGRTITKISATNSDEARAIVLDGNRPLVAGWVQEGNSSSTNFALVRYGANGEIDPTFGSGGIVVTPVAATGKPDQATAMVLQIDDRVPTVRAVVAGYAATTNYDFAIARYWR